MPEQNTNRALTEAAADEWKVLPSGLTVLVRPMPGYSGTHVIYATRFGSIDRDFRVDGCCCILFTGESDVPDTVKQLLLEEIRRIRAEGVDREIFTLCKNEKYGQLIENLENVEDSASQMADFALSGQTVAQQIATLAALTAEDADAALQKILSEERMAVMYIQPDGTAGEEPDDEEEMEE